LASGGARVGEHRQPSSRSSDLIRTEQDRTRQAEDDIDSALDHRLSNRDIPATLSGR
jgi:hypothetical protein